MRRLGPVPPGGRAPGWWWLGCHGGAATSTLASAIGGSGDGGRYWPAPVAGEESAVVLVARTHAAGLAAAQAAARQWAAGEVPERIELLGLVAVADAPGRLPRSLRELLDLVAGGVPRMWRLPWVEALRCGTPPTLARLPSCFTALSVELHQITTRGST